MAIATGVRLGPYEILGPLGAGGMGEVYRAKDTRLGREVAVKVLPESLGQSPDALRRFDREARAVAALSHSHILGIHDVGESNGTVYAVMELLDGETLRARLSASALPPRKAVEYALQIARGLAAAHERGIVHRDLKPENVFLTREGIIKILDFGLAMVSARPSQDPDLSQSPTMGTQPGIVLGTPGYMSPEQVRGRPVDHRTDLFALGAILYEMLTGRRAFHGESPAEAMLAVLQEDPVTRNTGAQIAPELSRIVSHCLEKEPGERFQNARDLAFALEAWQSEPASTIAPSGVPSGASPAEASIAVLPFRNMSADKDAEYFSDGITEEIISALSGIGPMRVAARTSSFAFKGKDTDVRQIGRELGVRTVLEGSVRQSGRRLRITAQLIDVTSGYQLWSERFDREMEDVFAVQDEIARAIVKTLHVKLVGSGDAPVVVPPTADVEAYNLYLKGRYYLNLRRPRPAIAEFNAAIELDHKYADAYEGLADAYCFWGFYGGISTWEAYGRARWAAEKANEIRPGAPEVHLSFALIEHYFGWDTAREEREIREVIEKSPKSSDGWFWLGLCLGMTDRFEEAFDAARRGIALEPHNANLQCQLGWCYMYQRRFREALVEFKKAVALDPNAGFPSWSIGMAYQAIGDLDAAIGAFERGVEITQGNHSFYIGLLGGALAEAGRTPEAERILADLEERSAREYVPPFDKALVLAPLGRKDDALTALERAYEERNALMWFRIYFKLFDPLRESPRWKAIAKRLALTAPVREAEA
jgi:eukaryotic-like serine/threonine-protein kinase